MREGVDTMQELRAVRRGGRVLWLRPEELEPGPLRPRRCMDREALRALADSVARFGILQPLTVRRRAERFELVAGERRLRAARMAGLEEVPCLLMELDDTDCGLLALVENLQRQELDFAECALSARRLLALGELTEEELARSLGRSPAALREWLRFGELPEELLCRLRDEGLDERHARELLALPDNAARRAALRRMCERRAEATEKRDEDAPTRRTRFVLKDTRVFLNSLQRAAALLRQGGVEVSLQQEETERELTVTVHICR